MYSSQLVLQRVDATSVRSYAQDATPPKPLKGDGMLLQAHSNSNYNVFVQISIFVGDFFHELLQEVATFLFPEDLC